MNELEQLLTNLTAELEQPLPAVEVPVVSAEGTSEDKLVRVTVSGGQVTDITIDPRAMRRSSVEFADDLRLAMNAALDAHAQALMTTMQEQAPDPAELSSQLGEVAREATRSLADYLDTMTRMMESTAAREG
ncbi:YbaB/EbfC family nucleoid-associated protein [Tessaracoccus defluvii]|uniref:YbaB/EbfC family nucleoid-associated protein n=1 Tax=Tessaracoccus defluvii TaxID=1285901 RepID=A0A7H0HA30_9ACTN|nr:YbaB/EbfC family nucleoid-associated protein [Tessaracoccus defluvii]QNP57396.1 YbaB/EbfC family nucleoid-associated protein [Tessaracoccus defluvii]